MSLPSNLPSKRQAAVLKFIEAFIKSHSYAPTYEEIGKGLGLKSTASVAKHIYSLRAKGLLEADHNRARSLRVPNRAEAKQRLRRIAEIIEDVDQRCMAADGPVTPTLQEMTAEEIKEIYQLAKGA